MIQDKKVKELQEAYLLDRTDENFHELYKEINEISKALLFVKAKRSGIFIDVYNLAEDATLRFMEMYLKDEKWYATNIVKRLDYDVLYIMYNKKQRQQDLESETLVVDMEIKEEIITEESTDSVIEDLMEDSKYWRNILIDCYKSRSFKEFITKLSLYENRKFCEDHMERLKNLYKHTRKDYNERRSLDKFITKLYTIEGQNMSTDHTERLKSLYNRRK